MRTVPSSWLLALACSMSAASLAREGPYIDEQLHVTITGKISCSSACGERLSIALVGTKLGDSAAEREVARVYLDEDGGAFVVTGSFLVGYEGAPPVEPSERLVTLQVQSSKCPVVKRELRLGTFVRDKYGYRLDIGTLGVDCSPK